MHHEHHDAALPPVSLDGREESGRAELCVRATQDVSYLTFLPHGPRGPEQRPAAQSARRDNPKCREGDGFPEVP